MSRRGSSTPRSAFDSSLLTSCYPSDICLVSSPEPEPENRILKIHRLGRISFRAVKSKRDYTRREAQRQNFSWMYLSRLAAAKEYQFMQALHEAGFPVPVPIAQSRHTVLMSLIDAYPLRQIAMLPKDQIPLLYAALMALIVRLAKAGLIHGDFNEFNLLIRELREESDEEDGHGGGRDYTPKASLSAPRATGAAADEVRRPDVDAGERIEQGKGFERVIATGAQNPQDDEDDHSSSDEEGQDFEQGEEDPASRVHLSDGVSVEPILIDFPQMVSVLHPNAEYYFDRDVACVRRFFRKRFRFVSEEYPTFREVVTNDKEWEEQRRAREKRRAAIAVGEAGNHQDEQMQEYLDLDVLTKASGYVKTDKQRGQFEDLDQYMSRMRMDDKKTDKFTSDSSSESDDDDGEDGDDVDEVAAERTERVIEGEDVEDASDQEDIRDSAQHEAKVEHAARSRKAKAGGVEDEDIASQIQQERRRAQRLEAKHHGKKAVAGKVGKNLRREGGGSKKKSDKVLVRDASTF